MEKLTKTCLTTKKKCVLASLFSPTKKVGDPLNKQPKQKESPSSFKSSDHLPTRSQDEGRNKR